ncbi:MAG: MetQ/NlpA family ABC transporter substrate-binding protein [Bacillota bacterium]|nr:MULTISPECIES: MetQ/NlpA family ABC transporter substrate-binding protein [Virgibacillus]MCC2248810.1 MetQ/NlpA family ABC transporter substrate-binding protein [Virgibacillus sp. AGTR]MDY7043270.1 MetQ/NlpA family ABC transporter substrate-binding protein [Virgibacillus sp. M23]QRZ17901.1 MetQ/NlpA family ABC transporter substrate-binding protein [Virgibacillus sp. AGTR]WBX78770.1 MetQ/NlpA family ABC transporter substrate-binding protein [Virgibacillus salarius]
MKKLWLSVLIIISLGFVLAACGGDDEASSDANTIKVGASSTPHAEILEEAKPLLKEEGITLEITEYEDYVLPNDDLANGEIDANYFQHIPYLEQTISDTGYKLDYIDGIHIEPIGVYSKGISSIEEIPEGTEVVLSNSVSDRGRVLGLFEKNGIIKLADGVKTSEATLDDITENPKNLTFSPDYDPALLPEIYETDEESLVVINTNYAIGAGLIPTDDALFIEDEDSPYVNVIAVRAEDKDNKALNKLVDVLHSEKIQKFIEEEYEGAVVPVGDKKQAD